MTWNRRAASLALITLVGACTVPSVGPKGTTVAVKLQTGAFLTQAARKTTADIDHYHLKLISTATNTVVSQADTTAQQTQFTQVPDGTYVLKADALDNTGHSIVQGGEQLSVNNAAVVSPNVTYSDNAGCLTVNLHLLDATGETINNHINVTDGSVWNGTPVLQVGGSCACNSCFGLTTQANLVYTVIPGAAAPLTAPFADGTLVSAAQSFEPQSMSFDAGGNLYYTTTGHSGKLWLSFVPVADGTYFGRAMHANSVYTILGGGSSTTDGAAATSYDFEVGRFKLDPAGNVFFVEWLPGNLYKVCMIPKASGTFYGQAMTANHVYTVVNPIPAGYGHVTIQDLLIDAAGNIFMVGSFDTGFGSSTSAIFAYANQSAPNLYGSTFVPGQVTQIVPNGVVYGQFMAFDTHQNLLVADSTGQNILAIPRVNETFYGQSLVAGSHPIIMSGANSAFGGFPGIAVDSANDIYVSGGPTGVPVIRYMPYHSGTYYSQTMNALQSYTIAGGGGSFADGVPPLQAHLDGLGAIALSPNGSLFMSAIGVRMIPAVACGP